MKTDFTLQVVRVVYRRVASCSKRQRCRKVQNKYRGRSTSSAGCPGWGRFTGETPAEKKV